MALSGQKTTSDFIEWNKLQTLLLKLERDGNWKFTLLIAIGVYTGLRISDILSIRWDDLLGKEFLEITEKKTKKFRKIKVNQHLLDLVNRISKKVDGYRKDAPIFLNESKSSTISIQYINRKLKQIVKSYGLVKEPEKIKSHSLRKSFGRRIFENNDNSEKSLILLNEIFNHTSIKTTKIYLGIRQQEIFDVYDSL
jgi:integrase